MIQFPRRAMLALAAGALAACASSEAPIGPGPTEPALAPDTFITADGTRLAMRAWLPEGAIKAVVVALHGFNDYSAAFDAAPDAPGTGAYLAACGIAVYAYDQRGFGQSSYAGLWAGRDALVADFAALVGVVQAAHPGAPVFALGESMGGAVVMAALAGARPPPVAGAILVAPAVWARATMPWPYRVALWLGARVAPGMRPTGRGLGRQASDNIAMLRANARDPLFIKKTRIDAIRGLVDLMDEALASPPRITTPVLYLYGAKDQIIPKAPTIQAMVAFDPDKARIARAYYPDSWHMMLRDKGAAVPLTDIAAFIADPDAPLPSEADRDALVRLSAAAKGAIPATSAGHDRPGVSR